jgi:parallel beta-helix repeat protein/predicted outer membrane repeat protein
MRRVQLLLLLFAVCCLGGGAGAAVINVPADQPTILDAIAVATTGDEVVLAPGTYLEGVDFDGKAITLRSTNPDDPEIVETTIIDGQESNTVVTFDQSEGNDSILTGLTITNGQADFGGGILCDGASPTITKNLIIGNGTIAEHGGGIACVNAASPIITNNKLKYNWAYSGGAIYLKDADTNPTITGNLFVGSIAAEYGACICLFDGATATISNNTFGALPPTVTTASLGDAVKARISAGAKAREAANAAKQGQKRPAELAAPKKPAKGVPTAARAKAGHTIEQIKALRSDLEGNAGDYGGVIYAEYCTLTLANNTYINNGAFEGGAIYAYYADVTVTDSTFLRNNAYYTGGAIYSTYATMNVSGCTFKACTSDYGGAVYFQESTGGFTNCQFDLTMANTYGGAIYFSSNESSPINLTNCDFLTSVSYYGGGLYIENTDVNLINCRFDNCHADNSYGGGIYIYGSDILHLSGCTFEGCSAYDYAGAIYADSEAEMHIEDSTFNRNVGGDYGHAIYAYYSRLHLHDCNFTGNVGSYYSYGAVYLNDSGFTGTELTSNEISGCLFEDNVGYQGGGVYSNAGELEVRECTFRGNVTSYSGGGMYVYDGSGSIENCLFLNNGASGYGGGLYCSEGDWEIAGNRFIGNRAYYYGDGEGGGVYCSTDSWIHHNVFCGNSADDAGGGLYAWGGYQTIENNSFSGNWAQFGGCIAGSPGTSSLTNNIFAYAERGGGVYFEVDPDVFICNNVYGNRGGNYLSGTTDMTGSDGNISVNPRYADRANCDLHLQSIGGRYDPATDTWVRDMVTSRCIDAGMSGFAASKNGIMEPLPNGGKLNMGAYGGTDKASKSSIFSYMHYYDGQGGLARAEKITFGFFDKMVQSSVLAHFSVEPPFDCDLTFPNDFTMIVTPNSYFPASSALTATFDTHIKRKDGTFTEWPEVFEWTTGNEPVIYGTLPEDGATGVDPYAGITISFDQAMVPNSVQNALRLSTKTGANVAVSSFSWSPGNHTVTVYHDDPFTPGAEYQVMLTRGAKSAAGVTLPRPYRFSFTVQDDTLLPAAITAAAATSPNGTVQVTVNLTAAANVGASIRNIAGKEIAVIPARALPAGVSTLLWDGKSKLGTAIPAGQYFVSLSAKLDDGTQCQCLAPLRK